MLLATPRTVHIVLISCLFLLLFIGYLYVIRSERQLVKDIEVNLAYRWFLGYLITEKIPDSSTISQNRIRRFKDTDMVLV